MGSIYVLTYSYYSTSTDTIGERDSSILYILYMLYTRYALYY